MTAFVRAYLRASTSDQDAGRAKEQLTAFAADHGVSICKFYVENSSGRKLSRPKLQELLSDSQQGDIILLEQVDRLTRLVQSDWIQLKAVIDSQKLKIVSLDLPTSWKNFERVEGADPTTSWLMESINNLLLELLASMSSKDYDDRRRRQAQGIAKAKADGRYAGRPENLERNQTITTLLSAGNSWTTIQAATGCSRATISKLAKRMSPTI